jgi:hypothetical protein
MPWQKFRHPQVRDLAWAGFSPPLLLNSDLRGAGLHWTHAWEQRLIDLDRDPAPLLDFIGDACSGRLGIYYERLWHYLLQEDENCDPVVHNLPVRAEGRTVGEFDCLYYCLKRRQHVHLELAVKLYLGVPERDYWLGPGCKDRLDLKLDHLLGKQIQLGTRDAARPVLMEYGIDHLATAVDIKGYLFNASRPLELPESYNPAVPMQHWYCLEDFVRLPQLPSAWLGWFRLPRHHWLAPHLHKTGEDTELGLPEEEIRDHFHRTGRPLLLAACDHRGEEQRRCFVTPLGWPGTGDPIHV